jgi:hypothetical protein
MNARLINSDPETLHRQADTCSAVAFLMLETSGKYFDLQMGAVKSSLDSFRGRLELLAPPASGEKFVAGYTEMLAESLNESGSLLRQGMELSADSQRRLSQLMEQGWLQMKDVTQKTIDEQLALANKIGKSITAGTGFPR